MRVHAREQWRAWRHARIGLGITRCGGVASSAAGRRNTRMPKSRSLPVRLIGQHNGAVSAREIDQYLDALEEPKRVTLGLSPAAQRARGLHDLIRGPALQHRWAPSGVAGREADRGAAPAGLSCLTCRTQPPVHKPSPADAADPPDHPCLRSTTRSSHGVGLPLVTADFARWLWPAIITQRDWSSRARAS